MGEPAIGAEAEVELVVAATDTAARLGVEPGEAYPEVLATRTMIGEMERAAVSTAATTSSTSASAPIAGSPIARTPPGRRP